MPIDLNATTNKNKTAVTKAKAAVAAAVKAVSVAKTPQAKAQAKIRVTTARAHLAKVSGSPKTPGKKVAGKIDTSFMTAKKKLVLGAEPKAGAVPGAGKKETGSTATQSKKVKKFGPVEHKGGVITVYEPNHPEAGKHGNKPGHVTGTRTEIYHDHKLPDEVDLNY